MDGQSVPGGSILDDHATMAALAVYEEERAEDWYAGGYWEDGVLYDSEGKVVREVSRE